MPVTDIEVVQEHIMETETEHGRIVSCAPGDATLYKLAIQKVDDASSMFLDECRGGWFVSITGFGESRMRTMYVRHGEHLSWRTVQKCLGVQAEGSAYVFTLILACTIGTACDTPARYLETIESYKKYTQ